MKVILTVCSLIVTLYSWSQSVIQIEKRANEALANQQYELAKVDFQTLFSRDPKSPTYNYSYGICLFYTNERSSALNHFQLASSLGTGICEAQYFIGRIHHLNYDFSRAISAYNAYLKCFPEDPKNARREIERCNNGKKLLINPTALEVLKSEQLPMNGFLSRIDFSDLGLSGGYYTDLTLQSKIDKKKGFVPHTFVKAGNKFKIYPSYGDSPEKISLYLKKKMGDEWSAGVKIPLDISAKSDALYPYYHSESGYLYFSSNGFNAMGGFDFFRVSFDPENMILGDVLNLGFPFSSTDDDFLFIPLDSVGNHAAFTTIRSSVVGKIEWVEAQYQKSNGGIVLVQGAFKDQVNPKNTNLQIKVKDLDRGLEYGPFVSDSSGEYQVILPGEGTYEFVANISGTQQVFVDKKVLPKQSAGIVFEQNINYQMKDSKEMASFSYQLNGKANEEMLSLKSMNIASLNKNYNPKASAVVSLINEEVNTTLSGNLEELGFKGSSVENQAQALSDRLLEISNIGEDFKDKLDFLDQDKIKTTANIRQLNLTAENLRERILGDTSLAAKKIYQAYLLEIIDSLMGAKINLATNEALIQQLENDRTKWMQNGNEAKASKLSENIQLFVLSKEEDSLSAFIQSNKVALVDLMGFTKFQREDSIILEQLLAQQKSLKEEKESLVSNIDQSRKLIDDYERQFSSASKKEKITLQSRIDAEKSTLSKYQKLLTIQEDELASTALEISSYQRRIELANSNGYLPTFSPSIKPDYSTILTQQLERNELKKQLAVNPGSQAVTNKLTPDKLNAQLEVVRLKMANAKGNDLEQLSEQYQSIESQLENLKEQKAIAQNENPTNNVDSTQVEVNNEASNGRPKNEPSAIGENGQPKNETAAVGENGQPKNETAAIGENGQPKNETAAGGENGQPKNETAAVGENGQPKNETAAVGENGQPKNETAAVGENGQPKTETAAGGENGQPKNELSAVGENGQPKNETAAGGENGQPKNVTSAVGENGQPKNETAALGENGQPKNETAAVGENGQPKNETAAGGENGQPKNEPSAVGENGQPKNETSALGENDQPKNESTGVGENGQPKNVTSAVGENGQPKNETAAVGENGQPKNETTGVGENGQPKNETREARSNESLNDEILKDKTALQRISTVAKSEKDVQDIALISSQMQKMSSIFDLQTSLPTDQFSRIFNQRELEEFTMFLKERQTSFNERNSGQKIELGALQAFDTVIGTTNETRKTENGVFIEQKVSQDAAQLMAKTEDYDRYVSLRKEWVKLNEETAQLEKTISLLKIQYFRSSDSIEIKKLEQELISISYGILKLNEQKEQKMTQIKAINNHEFYAGLITEGVLPLGQRSGTDRPSIKESQDLTFTINKEQKGQNNQYPILQTMPKGLVFRVQVGAFKNKVPDYFFREFTPVSGEVLRNGLTAYLAGFFEGSVSAMAARKAIRESGYKDAFVVAYCDGQRIPFAQAVAYEKNGMCRIRNKEELLKEAFSILKPSMEKDSSFASKPSEVFYTVQVASLAKEDNGKLAAVPELFYQRSTNGNFKYSSGKFMNLDEAKGRRDDLKTKGFQDAYIVAYRDGIKVSLGEAEIALNYLKEPVMAVQPMNLSLDGTEAKAVQPTFIQLKKTEKTLSKNQLGNYNSFRFVNAEGQNQLTSAPIDISDISPLELIYYADFEVQKCEDSLNPLIFTMEESSPIAPLVHDIALNKNIPFDVIKQDENRIQFLFYSQKEEDLTYLNTLSQKLNIQR